MQLLSPQRKVMFEGMQLVIPFDAQYLTIDDYGVIIAHGDIPHRMPGYSGCWEGDDELGVVGYVSEIDGKKWKMENEPFFVGDEGPMIGDMA